MTQTNQSSKASYGERVDPSVETRAGRDRIRECLGGAARDNQWYAELVEACDLIDGLLMAYEPGGTQ
jgi:hypothetical protein